MKRREPTRQQKEIVASAIQNLFEQKLKFDEAKSNYELAKKNLQPKIFKYMDKHMDKENSNALKTKVAGESSMFIRAVKSQRTKVNYFLDALQCVLPDDVLKDCVNTEVSITDIDKLMKLCKEAGVDREEFMSCLQVTKTVDDKRMGQAMEMGVFCLDDLDGCYEVVPTCEPYILLKAFEQKEEKAKEAHEDDEEWEWPEDR